MSRLGSGMLLENPACSIGAFTDTAPMSPDNGPDTPPVRRGTRGGILCRRPIARRGQCGSNHCLWRHRHASSRPGRGENTQPALCALELASCVSCDLTAAAGAEESADTGDAVRGAAIWERVSESVSGHHIFSGTHSSLPENRRVRHVGVGSCSVRLRRWSVRVRAAAASEYRRACAQCRRADSDGPHERRRRCSAVSSPKQGHERLIPRHCRFQDTIPNGGHVRRSQRVAGPSGPRRKEAQSRACGGGRTHGCCRVLASGCPVHAQQAP